MICLWLSSAMLLLLFTESMQRNPTAVLCWSRVKARSAWARGDATTTTTRFWARWHRRGACRTHAWSCLSCERKTRAKEGWGRLAHCLMHSTDLVSSVRVATSCVTHPLLFLCWLADGLPTTQRTLRELPAFTEAYTAICRWGRGNHASAARENERKSSVDVCFYWSRKYI